MINLTLLSHLKNTSKAYIIPLLCCAPLCAMETSHAMEKASNQEVFAPQEVSALAALATISVAHHATQRAPAKKFTCPTCGKNLASNHSLTVHQRTHTVEKPFKCDVSGCTYAAAKKSSLTDHQRKHTGETFKCDFHDCGYNTIYKKDLIRHIKIHHGKKPFKCNFHDCTYTATRKVSLTNHQKRSHHLEPKRTLDDNLDLEKNKRYRPEEDSATETELEENLS